MANFFLNTSGPQWLFRLHHNHGTNYHTIYIFHFMCCSCWRVCICNQLYYTIYFTLISIVFQGRRGRDRMVVGFTTICAIRTYPPWICEFLSSSWRRVLDTTKFVSDLRQVGGFLWVLRFPPLHTLHVSDFCYLIPEDYWIIWLSILYFDRSWLRLFQ
jgi:hypothetical protein